MAGYKGKQIVIRDKHNVETKSEYKYEALRSKSGRYPYGYSSWYESRLGTDERREDYI